MKLALLLVSGVCALTSIAQAATPIFSHGHATVSISEGIAPGKSIFQTAAADPDGGTVSYSLAPNDFFTIYPDSDRVVTIKALDYETQSSHTLTLIATDEQAEQTQVTLTVNLVDETEISANPSDTGSNYPGQQGTDKSPITSRKFAVYLIRFADADLSLFPGGSNVIFPTKAEIRELLNGTEVQRYWQANSWGQYSPEMDVFGYFDHPQPLSDFPTPLYSEPLAALGGLQVNSPGYDADAYDVHVFIFMNDTNSSWTPGARAGYTSFTINGEAREGDYISHGAYIRETGVHGLNEKVPYAIVNQNDDWEEGEQDYALNRFQRTYLHEAAHILGLGWHENYAFNGTRPAWQLKDTHVTDHLNSEYGNLFALLGRSQFSMNMTAASRDFLGWSNHGNRYSIKTPGKHTVRIQPINRTTGYRFVEVRIPDRPNQFSIYKNHGYLLEVREDDIWSDFGHPAIAANTEGVLLLATDGGGSRLLDASPSPLLNPWDPNGIPFIPDYRDLALKPGMQYENHEVRFSNVVDHGDGSFSIDIEVFADTGTEVLADASLNAFRQRYFQTTANSGDAADDADPDGDGLGNRIERALGTDPTVHNSGLLTPQTVRIDDRDYYELTLKTAVTAEVDTTLILESSTNLSDWKGTHFDKVRDVVAQNFDARSQESEWTRARLVTYRTKEPVPDPETPALFWRLAIAP